MKEKLIEDLKTLIPPSYQARIQPLSLNSIEEELIVSLIHTKMEQFIKTFMKKQQFAFGMKIFPFDNRVVSMHLVVIRIEEV